MILRNKLTKETLNISHAEFRAMFSKEIQVALDSYIRTQNNKQTFKFNKNFESDFYFLLDFRYRWIFLFGLSLQNILPETEGFQEMKCLTACRKRLRFLKL